MCRTSCLAGDGCRESRSQLAWWGGVVVVWDLSCLTDAIMTRTLAASFAVHASSTAAPRWMATRRAALGLVWDASVHVAAWAWSGTQARLSFGRRRKLLVTEAVALQCHKALGKTNWAKGCTTWPVWATRSRLRRLAAAGQYRWTQNLAVAVHDEAGGNRLKGIHHLKGCKPRAEATELASCLVSLAAALGNARG